MILGVVIVRVVNHVHNSAIPKTFSPLRSLYLCVSRGQSVAMEFFDVDIWRFVSRLRLVDICADVG